MAIRVLDQHTAELIAAGEVVERPSSVIKELVENALDAGATSITVEIERGGIARMMVQDDGGGIQAEDIPLAFLRHATSKVRTKEDLDSIHTLGFRGEALASIASVSQVELLTKTEQDEYASLYSIAGGQELGLEPAARPVGTTMTINNLFYNTPARMKFLKKDASEGSFVTETVTRLALSHPAVAFRYVRDGKRVFTTPGDGSLQSAAYAVLGADFARDLVQVEAEIQRYQVEGLVTPPRASRASRSMQFFFINGRFVKNRTMMAALEQAYRGMMMQGKFPGGILFLTMPADLVDVNVHPAKTEVRFAKESDVFDVVYKAVKSALVQASAAHSSFSMGTAGKQDVTSEPVAKNVQTSLASPVSQGTTGSRPVEHLASEAVPYITKQQAPLPTEKIQAYNDMVQRLSTSSNTVGQQPPAPIYAKSERELSIERDDENQDEAIAVFTSQQKNELAMQPSASEHMADEIATSAPVQTGFVPQEAEQAALQFVGEIFKTYILAQQGDVLCVIDKHAAHERMIYEQLMANREDPDAQQLLSPVTVALSAEEKNAVLQNNEALLAAGIEAEDFGGNEVLVRSVPSDVEPGSVEDLLVEVAGRLAVNSKDNMNEKTEWVLHSVSCRAAIKAGDKTHPAQLLEVAQQIMDGKIPPFCPHGRPVVLEITRKELEKQFGRLG